MLYFQWVDDRTKDIDDKVVKVEKEKTFFQSGNKRKRILTRQAYR